VLIQAPDSLLVPSATIWFDPDSGTAEFEPVGTHRDFRRMGLGTIQQLHGMARAGEADAQ